MALARAVSRQTARCPASVVPSSRSLCAASQQRRANVAAPAAKTPAGISRELEKDVAKALERAERAADTWSLQTCDFLTPPAVAEVQQHLQFRGDVQCVVWGGYSSAERCRVVFGREELLLEGADDPQIRDFVQAVQVKGNFMFDAATHRDFLGALLGTGIDRRTVGDILVQGEQGAQILCAPEMVDHLESSLTSVRTVKTETTRIALSELSVPAPKVQELSSSEASLRVDAVGSAGFRVSRAKMAAFVKGGDVRVNWAPCGKPSVEVGEGDVISCAGKGRLEVRGVEETKKGRYKVDMVRYI